MSTIAVARTATVLVALTGLVLGIVGLGTAGAASSGGIGDAATSTTSGEGDRRSKYDRLWERVPVRERRWARQTAKCESGGDPDAIGGGGRYRGAFQFMRATWKSAPKSPGGDPIRHPYRTQAVVAVALKRRDGAGHWPVCG